MPRLHTNNSVSTLKIITMIKNALLLQQCVAHGLRAASAWLGGLGLWVVLAAGAAAAEPIYRVEMIVFERTTPTSSESWPKNLTLEYPERWRKLAKAAPGDAVAGEPAALQPAAPQPATDFFTYLPREKRSLQAAREALDRSRQMRVVFHESWRQPLGAIEKSPALIVHGGNPYDAHHELEGYIQLGISRFLHLHTNLWFTQFTRNHGQLPESWPKLPSEPSSRTAEDSGSAEFADFPAPGTDTAQDTSAQAPYVINQIVTLQQKRRLRSGELHYLDHPRIGILIKIVPEDKAAPDA